MNHSMIGRTRSQCRWCCRTPDAAYVSGRRYSGTSTRCGSSGSCCRSPAVWAQMYVLAAQVDCRSATTRDLRALCASDTGLMRWPQRCALRCGPAAVGGRCGGALCGLLPPAATAAELGWCGSEATTRGPAATGGRIGAASACFAARGAVALLDCGASGAVVPVGLATGPVSSGTPSAVAGKECVLGPEARGGLAAPAMLACWLAAPACGPAAGRGLETAARPVLGLLAAVGPAAGAGLAMAAGPLAVAGGARLSTIESSSSSSSSGAATSAAALDLPASRPRLRGGPKDAFCVSSAS